MKEIRNKYIFISFTFSIFFICYVFFTQVKPIIFLDIDDWEYMVYSRLAVPLWGDWNPSRILPELLMSFCTNIGVFIINPFLNDYVGSISQSYGIFVSVFITVYIYRLMHLIKEKFNISDFLAVGISILFFLFHFWAWRYSRYNNDYFFRTHDATCYFYYIIPNLLNATLVFYFLEKGKYSFDDYKSKKQLGILILGIYFSVFSNMYPSVILTTFFSWVILSYYIKNRKHFDIIVFVKKNTLPILEIFLWIVSVIFEMSGGRAEEANKTFDLLKTIKLFVVSVYENSNILFVLFGIIVSIVFNILFIAYRKKYKEYKAYLEIVIPCIYCIVVTTLYNILLCTKVDSSYIQRTDILFSAYSYVFLLLSVEMCMLIEISNVLKVSMPLFLIIVYSISFVNGVDTFKESNARNFEPSKCRQINEYLIKQLKEADEMGISEIDLHIPVFNNDNNWPLADFGVQRISTALHQHHIISRRITVHFYPDKKVNETLGISIEN